MTSHFHISTASIGESKGTKRVWLEGALVAAAGFEPKTRYQVEAKDGKLILTKSIAGHRGVASRVRRGREIPIIDINNTDVQTLFGDLPQVRVIYKEDTIEITMLESDQRAKERLLRTKNRILNGEPLQVGSLAHGGGIMSHAIHAGMAKVGVKTELAFANEIREDLTDHAMTFNDVWTKKTIALQGKMQELAFDQYVMQNIPQTDHIEVGIPCSGAALPGRAKLKTSRAEQHPHVGHLVLPLTVFIARSNPTTLTLECVTQYADTASADILRTMLNDLHYDVHEIVLSGAEYNALEDRKRFVLVAVTKGIKFSFADLYRPAPVTQVLGSILEPMPLDAECWKPMQNLKDKEVRDAAAGKSFKMQIFNAESTKIGTLTKGMSKGRSTDPKIQHPTNPDLLRIPTAREHFAAKQIPHHLIGDQCETIANEIAGQAIIYKKIEAVAMLVGNAMHAYATTAVEAVKEEEFQLI